MLSGFKTAQAILRICIILSFVAITAGCAHRGSTKIAAIAGDEEITDEAVKLYMDKNPLFQNKEDALNNLVQTSILFQEAKRFGYDKSELIENKINAFIRQTVTSYFVSEKITKKIAVSEEDAKKLYDSNWRGIKFPRWIGILMVEIHYSDETLRAMAEEYARSIRDRFSDKDFIRNDEKNLNSLKTDLTPVAGITVSTRYNKKLFITKYRQNKLELEILSDSLKEGEMSVPEVNTTARSVRMMGIVKEYPQEEITFEKVKNELTLGAGEILYREKVQEYIDSVKGRYQIQYFK